MKETLDQIITRVLLNKIKFVGEGDHTYLGTPQELINDLVREIGRNNDNSG